MSEKKDLRRGFTTGSCAAAAAKAAAYMLLAGRVKEEIRIETPAGIPYEAKLEEIRRAEHTVSCAVRKDAGDDPDVTNGSLVYAEVTLVSDERGEITIDGGEGVGRVTRPGLDQPVGNAAINSVPRRMIEKEVREVAELFDRRDSLKVLISVPAGRELAAQTFNPRLGIEGGISILGTTGIVEPMSMEAILATIGVEVHQRAVLGERVLVITPGNYGREFMNRTYGYDIDRAVKCSNFIGRTIDLAAKEGFSGLLLVGHIGKLVKVAGGIMNTHSHEADSRMELLAAAAIRAGADISLAAKILDCLTTEEACAHLRDAGLLQSAGEELVRKISYYIGKRAGAELPCEVMVYANEFGLIGASAGAEKLLMQGIRSETGGRDE